MTVKQWKKEIREEVQVKLGDSNYIRMYGLHLLAGTALPKATPPTQ